MPIRWAYYCIFRAANAPDLGQTALLVFMFKWRPDALVVFPKIGNPLRGNHRLELVDLPIRLNPVPKGRQCVQAKSCRRLESKTKSSLREAWRVCTCNLTKRRARRQCRIDCVGPKNWAWLKALKPRSETALYQQLVTRVMQVKEQLFLAGLLGIW
jgi:hypothetical protein